MRDVDGLALSSRNRYLNATERKQALAIPQAIQCVRRAIANGQGDAVLLREALHEHLKSAEGVRLDYAELVDANTLEPVEAINGSTLVAVAAFVGSTRLIDNLLVDEPVATEVQFALTTEEAA